MTLWIERLKSVGWIAHWFRAIDRFLSRLGIQFAAAVTYFSVLSLIPILMVAFAALGLTITILVPDLLDRITAEINSVLSGSGSLGEQLNEVVDQALNSWRAVGIIGLLSAGWTGSKWVLNIRLAIRAQTRPRFEVGGPTKNVVVETLQDLGILFALLFLVALTFALSSAATAARSLVSDLLQLQRVPGGDLLLSLGPIVSSLVAGFVLFLFLFRVFPDVRFPRRTLIAGSLIGSVGMAALQYTTGLLISMFNNNPASAVFGNVIVVMLFCNLFAMLILVVAAWMVTDERHTPPVVVVASDLPRQPSDYATKSLLAELRETGAPTSGETAPQRPDRALRARIASGAIAGALVAWGLTVVARPLARLARHERTEG